MANVKISQLPVTTSLTGSDVFPVVSGATTYQVSATNLTAFATSGLGNISTVNLNGNASTVLAGDGTWVAQSGGSGNATSLNNGSAAFTLFSDGTLFTSSTGNTAANFVVNGNTPDIDLRNNSGTGSYTNGGTEYVMRVGGTNNLILDNTGTLKLPAKVSSPGVGEAQVFVGTRAIVGGLSVDVPYSAQLVAGTPSVAYLASVGSTSVKVTFAVQSSGSGFQWEQFDVVAVVSQDVGGAVNFVVSNRVKGNSTIPDTVVTATMNVNQIEISLTLDAVQTSGGTSSFNAVEFGLMID